MIAALCWLASRLTQRRTRSEITLARTVTSWKRDRYDINPMMRMRTRIPKVGKL